MTTRRLTTWVGLTTATAAVIHLLWSFGVAETMALGYPHRVPDLQRWPGPPPTVAAQRELLARFISWQLRRAWQPTVAFLGSSVSFGYPWQERVILSRRYSALRPEQRVVNASVTGSDLSRVNNWAICAFKRQALMVDVAIIEIPVIGTVAHLAQQYDAGGTSAGAGALESCIESRVSDGYLSFVFKQPLGLGWVRFLWDVEAYEKDDESIAIVPVPEGYFVTADKFARIEEVYRTQIIEALTRARTIARHVYVFPSPVYLPALSEIHEDATAVEHQLAVTAEACRAVIDIECLDATPFYVVREDFYNMTHLNQRGHEAMAQWLAARVLREP